MGRAHYLGGDKVHGQALFDRVTSGKPQGSDWQRIGEVLAHLGDVGVSATLREGQFTLRFDASDPATVALLRDRQALLLGRFDAAGLKLSTSQVFQHVDEIER